MDTLIPDENLSIAEWWNSWKSGALFGYGGARAPEEPRPIEAPSAHPTPDYRKEIREAIKYAQDLAREIAAQHDPRDDSLVITAGLRYGTAVEEFPDGSMHILNLMTELMMAFRSFYTRFCALGRKIPCNDPYLTFLADRVVRLRLLLVAIRAQEHIDETIDDYIVQHVIRLIP